MHQPSQHRPDSIGLLAAAFDVYRELLRQCFPDRCLPVEHRLIELDHDPQIVDKGWYDVDAATSPSKGVKPG